MHPTIRAEISVYADPDCRNWLAVRGCLVSPTKLGELEIQFTSDTVLTEFLLLFSKHVCTQSTT